MAEQSNVQAEETLGLLHTSEALERAQLAYAAVPKGLLTTQGDSEFDDLFGDKDDTNMEDDAAGPSEVPEWVYNHNYSAGDNQIEVLRQSKSAMEWENDEDTMKKTLSMFVKDNLRLQKSHFNQVRQEINDLKHSVTIIKEDNQKNLEARLPLSTLSSIRSKLNQESSLKNSFASLDKRVSDVEGQLNQVLINQCNQQRLLLSLFEA